MALTLSDLRPVYVVGGGLHRFHRPTVTSFVGFGLTAVRAALADSGVPWTSVEIAYTGHGRLATDAPTPRRHGHPDDPGRERLGVRVDRIPTGCPRRVPVFEPSSRSASDRTTRG